MKKTHTIADVRATINDLLKQAELEHLLESQELGGCFLDRPFTADRKLGVLTFTLAAICFRNKDALDILNKRVADLSRHAHILQHAQERRKNGSNTTK